MLHLENFFEKSFALLLTTPNSAKWFYFHWNISDFYCIISYICVDLGGIRKNEF